MQNGDTAPRIQDHAAEQIDARLHALICDLSERVNGFERAIAELDLIEAERADITLAERLASTRGGVLGVQLEGGEHWRGTLLDSATSWILLDLGDRLALIALGAVNALREVGRASQVGSRVELARTFASVCRRLGTGGARVRINCGAHQILGTIAAVGQDFVEMQGPDRQVVTVRIGAIRTLEAWGVGADGY